MNDFVIRNGVLIEYVGPGGDVTIPEEVHTIGDAFSYNTKVTRLLIPQGVTQIGYRALERCDNLEYISPLNPKCKLDQDTFGDYFPMGLLSNLDSILPNMTDGLVKKLVSKEYYWERISEDVKLEIFATRQSGPIQKAYQNVLSEQELEPMVPKAGIKVCQRLTGKVSTKTYNEAAAFVCAYHQYLSDDTIRSIYSCMIGIKSAEKALNAMDGNVLIMERMGKKTETASSLEKAEALVMNDLLSRKLSPKDLEAQLKDFYSLESLPSVKYRNGKKADPMVLMWLMVAHEKTERRCGVGNPEVVAAYNKPGISPEAQKIIAELDPENFQSALIELAKENFTLKGRSKKMFVAYPICRYADENTLEQLMKIKHDCGASEYTFQCAILYNEAKTCLFYADKHDQLDKYAEIRGTDPDTIRDQYLSDVGLDPQGGKTYDLGNQMVTARLQKDLSFLVEMPNGKTSKSLPKKGADEALYAAANTDFAEMKKNSKKIVKRRGITLFEDFLSGRERSGADWKAAYLHNPLLRMVARMLVWSQNGQTFTLTETDAVNSDGAPIQLRDDAPVILAHPMEMSQSDLLAWQKYFTANGIKQPFEQIWEPVAELSSVKEDRYMGCMIPYYRFIDREKIGIHVEDFNFHNEITISFDGCTAEVERVDWLRHMIEMGHRFEIKKFVVCEHNRKTNHIVAYLDRVTIFERIRKDDVSVAALLPRFTLAQITEFIKIAAENNCPNVQAILLDYKNRNFADFDPMEEFSLDL